MIINGGFQVLKKLDEGGQASVFKVRDLNDKNMYNLISI